MQLFGNPAGYHPALSGGAIDLGAKKVRQGFIKVAQGGRKSPDNQFGNHVAQPGEGQLGLYPALGAEQFMPLVYDHAFELRELLLAIFSGKRQRKALRRGQ